MLPDKDMIVSVQNWLDAHKTLISKHTMKRTKRGLAYLQTKEPINETCDFVDLAVSRIAILNVLDLNEKLSSTDKLDQHIAETLNEYANFIKKTFHESIS